MLGRILSLGRIGCGGRVLAALVIAAISVVSYCASSEYNPITEETQQVALSFEEEVAMGRQVAPELIQRHGGLYRDEEAQDYIDEICSRIVNDSEAADTEWPFECHLLADRETINAFALPGGQIFITAALFRELETEGQLAGVLAHEIGHVVARHAAEQLAEKQLAEGLRGATVIAAYDPEDPRGGLTAEQLSALVSNLVTLRYGREDELQSDLLGVQFMAEAGYDPRAMIGVMEVLAEAGDGRRPPEFFNTHPNPDNRIARLEETIESMYPADVPDDLES